LEQILATGKRVWNFRKGDSLKANITIYTKDGCSYCIRALKLIKIALDVNCIQIDLTNNPEQHERVKTKTGMKTVPVIFVGECLIGGFDALEKSYNTGHLTILILEEENRLLKNEITRLKRSL
jgi:glutaredoxin 3